MMNKNIWHMLIILVIGIFCIGGNSTKEHLIAGATMGTTYHIKIIAPRTMNIEAVQKHIDQRLEQLNQSMSTHRKDSEINLFNSTEISSQPFVVSADFLKVMLTADKIYTMTAGAWDGTVHPLVDLWGFGGSGTIEVVPSSAAINTTLEKVGFKYIEVSPEGYLKKRHGQVTINLASIAKGYGVDVVARMIGDLGYRNYLVEIGGEVYASGRRLNGALWKVGVNQPSKNAPATQVYKALNLENRAMATSGDYRNFIEIEGRTYSHIIDPRTGYPVTNGVVSTSVIAPNCTFADGLATALMVMGPAEGMRLINKMEHVEGLMIVQQPDGRFENHWSKGIISDK